MKELSFFDAYKKPLCLALGFFDCLHKGHMKIINEVVSSAKTMNCQSAVFTFSNNPFEVLNANIKPIFDYEERLELLKSVGVDCVLNATFDKDFQSMPHDVFLKHLKDNFDTRLIACGEDYKFGKNSEGNVQKLEQFCNENNIEFKLISTLFFCQKKYSSTLVREALCRGDITLANSVLGRRYAIKGVVEHGRGVGAKIGFPTANLSMQKSKLFPMNGVYKTLTKIDQKNYFSLTHIGGAPTFFEDTNSIETFVIGFEGDLYGKQIIVEFFGKLRETKQFASAEELRQQILFDIGEISKCKE